MLDPMDRVVSNKVLLPETLYGVVTLLRMGIYSEISKWRYIS
jgi:hypothetical protein